MAEWLGRGLQNLVQRFESASDLNAVRDDGVFLCGFSQMSPFLCEFSRWLPSACISAPHCVRPRHLVGEK